MNRNTFLRLWRGTALAALVVALAACGGGEPDTGSAGGGGTGTPASGGSTGSTGPTGSTGGTGGTGGSGSGSGGSGGTPVHAGMGVSVAAPTGQPWAWPQDVQVEQPIKGDDTSCIPPGQKAPPPTGRGGLVRVCLGFRNTGLVPVTVTLPPGLVFVSDDLQTQNGVALSAITIVVPASTTTYFVPVNLFCLNLYRLPTLGAQDTWQVGPVTDDASVRELLALLQGKTLTLAADFPLQQILWDITDGAGLTPEDRAAIAAL